MREQSERAADCGAFALCCNRAQDLGQIYRHLREQSGSGAVARRFVDELRAKCSELAGAPIRMGRPRPELRPDLRRHPHKSYVIFFRYVGDDVLEIVNVLEGHRDIQALFGEGEQRLCRSAMTALPLSGFFDSTPELR